MIALVVGQFIERTLTPAWNVRYHFAKNERGELVVGRLEILSSHGDVITDTEGVTADLVRQVTMTSAKWSIKAQTVRVSPEARPLRPNRRGARMTSKDLLALLARHQHLGTVDPKNPAKTLARELKANRATVRTWLVRARILARQKTQD